MASIKRRKSKNKLTLNKKLIGKLTISTVFIGVLLVIAICCETASSQSSKGNLKNSKRKSTILNTHRVEPINRQNSRRRQSLVDRYEFKLNRYSSSLSDPDIGTVEDYIRRPAGYQRKKPKNNKRPQASYPELIFLSQFYSNLQEKNTGLRHKL